MKSRSIVTPLFATLAVALLLSACSKSMSIEELTARTEYCTSHGMKAVHLVSTYEAERFTNPAAPVEVICVKDSLRFPSKYQG